MLSDNQSVIAYYAVRVKTMFGSSLLPFVLEGLI